MIYIVQNDNKVPSGYFGELLKKWHVEHQPLPIYDNIDWPEITTADSVIILGGYMGANDEAKFPYLKTVLEKLKELAERNVPILAICLGAQLLARALGATVQSNVRNERGNCTVNLAAAAKDDPLLIGFDSPLAALQWHQDSFDLPPDATLLGNSRICPNQIFRFKRAYAVQFHPEVTIDIVADWVKRKHADPEILSKFKTDWPSYRAISERLLANFIALAIN